MRAEQPSQRKQGFTVIEVMIVLAIGGFILLMMFAIIPTITRNSRNSQRRQDVSLLVQAVTKFALNNSGGFPQTADTTDLIANAKLSYYDAANVKIQAVDPANAATLPAPNPVVDVETVAVYNYQKCDDANPGKSIGTAAGYADVVALFAVETGGGGVKSECQAL